MKYTATTSKKWRHKLSRRVRPALFISLLLLPARVFAFEGWEHEALGTLLLEADANHFLEDPGAHGQSALRSCCVSSEKPSKPISKVFFAN